MTLIALREHALFSIRNILKNNEENQAMIENLKPQYRVGEFGELHDLPPAMR
jgi:ataxin-10